MVKALRQGLDQPPCFVNNLKRRSCDDLTNTREWYACL
jgi:hypothetical protein